MKEYGPVKPLENKPRITVNGTATVFVEARDTLSIAHGQIKRAGLIEDIFATGKTPTKALYVLGVEGRMPELRKGVFSPTLGIPSHKEMKSEYVD